MSSAEKTNIQCHVCTEYRYMNDKFCRNCGNCFYTSCMFCKFVVETSDKFCANCGSQRWPYVEQLWYDTIYQNPEHFLRGSVSIVLAASVIYFAFLRSKPAPIPSQISYKPPLPATVELISAVYHHSASAIGWCGKIMHLW